MLASVEIKKIKNLIKNTDCSPLPEFFKILGDSTRFKIFWLLIKCGPFCPTDLSKIFEISLSVISHHCRLLELAGLVRRVKMGKMVCYELCNDNPLVQTIAQLIK
jgi:DNA-binding transcriptional ArsR family regulator